MQSTLRLRVPRSCSYCCSGSSQQCNNCHCTSGRISAAAAGCAVHACAAARQDALRTGIDPTTAAAHAPDAEAARAGLRLLASGRPIMIFATLIAMYSLCSASSPAGTPATPRTHTRPGPCRCWAAKRPPFARFAREQSIYNHQSDLSCAYSKRNSVPVATSLHRRSSPANYGPYPSMKPILTCLLLSGLLLTANAGEWRLPGSTGVPTARAHQLCIHADVHTRPGPLHGRCCCDAVSAAPARRMQQRLVSSAGPNITISLVHTL